jgi:nucleoside-diphosphate-sugar epimerase
MAEERLRALVPQGLDVVILRPAITYGKGDYGFPYSLIKLVDSGLYVHCDRDLWVHMGDVQILADAFLRAAKAGVRSGSAYIIADRAPVSMRALVDSICYELRGRPYPRWKRLPGVVFDWACFTSGRVAKSERWKTRLQLISQSWYYDVGPAQRDLELELTSTIDRFRSVVEWYLGSTRGDRWRSPS